MKNFVIVLFFACLTLPVLGQNEGKDLYIVYDPETPIVTKDIRKYRKFKPSVGSVLRQCGMAGNSSQGIYTVGYPFYCGTYLNLNAEPNRPIQTIPLSDVATLYAYPKGRTPAQLDEDIQPTLDLDYELGWSGGPKNSRTVKYWRSFSKIYVIELDRPNVQARIVEVFISNVFSRSL